MHSLFPIYLLDFSVYFIIPVVSDKSNHIFDVLGRNNNPGGASAMKAVVSATKTEAANNADQIGGGPKLTHQQLAEKEKKRIARKKERRATLILGLIMGSFIACWFPFFFMYSISPICPICENFPVNERPACCVRGWGFTFAFWLGYSNSALNPVIYTIFNKDFRRAFKRILFKWIWILEPKLASVPSALSVKISQ